MFWYYVIAYVFVVCCMVYWSLRAFRAEARLLELTMLSKALVEHVCKVVELSNSIINDNEEVNKDGE